MNTKFRIEKGSFEMKARPVNYTVADLRDWLCHQTEQDHSEIIGIFDTVDEAKERFTNEKNNCITRRVKTAYGFSAIKFDEIQIVEFEVDEDGEDTYDLYEIYDIFIAYDKSLSKYEDDEEENDDDDN